MYDDSRHPLDPAEAKYEVFRLPPHDWVPNNRRLSVVIYCHALNAGDKDLADRFDALFAQNEWPPQWRDGIFDYHHFHSTAREALGIASGSAHVILGGPGGRVVHVEAGDALLLPAGTGHCLQSFEGRLLVVGACPPGQQWDIRREALTLQEREAMESLPFPMSDPVFGSRGPLPDHWSMPQERGR